MSHEYALIPNEHHRSILQNDILGDPDYVRIRGGHESPRAIILAGQPGSGKGGLAKAAEREFNDNIAVIDTDEMRAFHPQVKDFRRQHPYTWSGDTHGDASRWANELRADAMAQRKHLVIDTTTPRVGLIEELQRQGSRFEFSLCG